MMKSNKDNCPINIVSDNHLNENEDFYSIEQSISKFDYEQKDLTFNLTFNNSFLFNHDAIYINEDINDNITDKRYFIGQKTNSDTKKIYNQNNIKKNNIIYKIIIFLSIIPLFIGLIKLLNENIEKI